MSIISSASAAPASSDSASPPGSPARVKTLRPWSTSVWKSRTRAARPNASASRPSASSSPAVETLGTASRSASSAGQISSSPPPRIASPSISTVGSLTTTSRWTGTWIGAADPRRGAEGDVRGAEDLLVLEDVAGEDRLLVGADPELGDVGAVGAVRRSAVPSAGRPRRRSRRSGGRPRSVRWTGDSTRPIAAIEPSTTSVPSAVPSTGAMKPSPQGRLPKAPLAVSSPASTIPSRPSSEKRRSLPLPSVMRASEPRVQRVDDRPAAPAHLVEVAVHQPRQHLFGDAGQRRDPHARRRSPLCAPRCGTATGSSPPAPRRRRPSPRRPCAAARRRATRARRSRPGSRRRRRPAPRSASSAPISSVTGLQITSTSSPAETPMHCRTTVRTALSRSAPLTRSP